MVGREELPGPTTECSEKDTTAINKNSAGSGQPLPSTNHETFYGTFLFFSETYVLTILRTYVLTKQLPPPGSGKKYR